MFTLTFIHSPSLNKLSVSILAIINLKIDGRDAYPTRKVTAKEFSLIRLLSQHPEQVMSYEDIIKKLWGPETEAIHTRVIQHIYKLRKNILAVIGNNKLNKEKVKNILKVVPGRGVMLNIIDKKLKTN